MSPYHQLEKHTKAYNPVGQKHYANLARDDIIRLNDYFTHSRGIIQSGEMFEFMEWFNPTLCRVRRISTGKTYKVFISKFIEKRSMSGVTIWIAKEENCIWNKAK